MVRIPRRRYSDAEAHDAEAFFAELMGESTPPTPLPSLPSNFRLGVWVDVGGLNLRRHGAVHAALLHDLGVRDAALMVNRLDATTFALDAINEATIRSFAALLRGSHTRITLTSWLRPRRAYIDALIAQLPALALDIGAHAIELDVEEPWSKGTPVGFASHDEAAQHLLAGLAPFRSRGLELAMTAQVDAMPHPKMRAVLSGADLLIPQAYSTSSHAIGSAYGPRGLQRRAVTKVAEATQSSGSPIIMGLAAYGRQHWAGHTREDILKIELAETAALRSQGTIRGARYWSWKHIAGMEGTSSGSTRAAHLRFFRDLVAAHPTLPVTEEAPASHRGCGCGSSASASPLHPAADRALQRLAQGGPADRSLADQLRGAALHTHQLAGILPADDPRVASLAGRHGARMGDLLGGSHARLLDWEAPPTLIFHPSLGAPSALEALSRALAEAGRSMGAPNATEDDTSLPYFLRWSPGWRGPFPPRPEGAKGARELLAAWRSKKAPTAAERLRREEMFIEQVLIGNVPDWMAELTTLSLQVPHKGEVLRGEVQLLPDYLCIGSNTDFLHIPFDQLASQLIAEKLGMSVPTARVCHALYQHLRQNKPDRCLNAITRDYSVPDSQRGADTPKGVAQTATDAYIEHSEAIQARQRSRGLRNGTVVAGHKKDVTLSSRLHEDPNRIAFHGFYSAATHLPFEPCLEPSNAGKPTCQADFPALAHRNEGRFSDYAQGLRLMSRGVKIEGAFVEIEKVLDDNRLAWLLSAEGPIRPARIPPFRRSKA